MVQAVIFNIIHPCYAHAKLRISICVSQQSTGCIVTSIQIILSNHISEMNAYAALLIISL